MALNTTDSPFTLALLNYNAPDIDNNNSTETIFSSVVSTVLNGTAETIANNVVSSVFNGTTTSIMPAVFNNNSNSVVDSFIGVFDANETTNDTGKVGNSTSLGPPYLPVEQYVVPTVCVMGIILNILNLLVLTERCLKESPYTYLTAMAILCLASLTMSLVSHFSYLKYPHSCFWLTYTFKVYFPCVNICANSTMWLTAVLTIERFLFVRHPLWARAKCDRRSAKIKICIIVILMMILNIPRFFLYVIVPDHGKDPNRYKFNLTAFRRSETFLVISWIYSAVIQLIPMSILCATNFYLVYAVHRARLLRKRMQIRNNMEAEWSREQTRLTITLISIVFFFIICIMPSAFSDLHVAYALFGHGMPKQDFIKSDFYRTLQKTANLLVFCQLSFNFVLYSLFNDKFLTVFKHMLKRWVEAVRRRVSKTPGRNMFQLIHQDTRSTDKTKVTMTRSSTASCVSATCQPNGKPLTPDTATAKDITKPNGNFLTPDTYKDDEFLVNGDSKKSDTYKNSDIHTNGHLPNGDKLNSEGFKNKESELSEDASNDDSCEMNKKLLVPEAKDTEDHSCQANGKLLQPDDDSDNKYRCEDETEMKKDKEAHS